MNCLKRYFKSQYYIVGLATFIVGCGSQTPQEHDAPNEQPVVNAPHLEQPPITEPIKETVDDLVRWKEAREQQEIAKHIKESLESQKVDKEQMGKTVIPMMDSAKEHLPKLSPYLAYPFGLDAPLLDQDATKREDATLKMFIGIKSTGSVPTLVLIAPSLKESLSPDALRKIIFEHSDDPSLGLFTLSEDYTKDVSIEKSDKYVADTHNLYERRAFLRLGSFAEYEIYSPEEKLGTSASEVTDAMLLAKKAKWERKINDYHGLVDRKFADIDKEEERITADDIKSIAKDSEDHLVYPSSIEKLIIAESLLSKDVVAEPISIYTLINVLTDEEYLALVMNEPREKDKLLVAKSIADRALAEAIFVRGQCEKRENKNFEKSIQANNQGHDDDAKKYQLLQGFYRVCRRELRAFVAEFTNAQTDLTNFLEELGTTTAKPLDVYAERAIALYDRLLGKAGEPSSKGESETKEVTPESTVPTPPPPPPPGPGPTDEPLTEVKKTPVKPKKTEQEIALELEQEKIAKALRETLAKRREAVEDDDDFGSDDDSEDFD